MKAALSVFLRCTIEMRPAFDNSASRRSVIAISVGHFRSTPPSSVGKVCVGRLSTSPPDSTPRIRTVQPYSLKARLMFVAHHVGRVHPAVFFAPLAVRLLLEREFLDRLRLRRRTAAATAPAACRARHNGCPPRRAVPSTPRSRAYPSACRCRADSSVPRHESMPSRFGSAPVISGASEAEAIFERSRSS